MQACIFIYIGVNCIGRLIAIAQYIYGTAIEFKPPDTFLWWLLIQMIPEIVYEYFVFGKIL